MNSKLSIGQKVEAADGYSTKQGHIIEIDENGRCRVMWLKRDGSNDKRTWMRPQALRVVA